MQLNFLSFLGQWSAWQAWSPCSNDCKQVRKRVCRKGELIVDEKYCPFGEKLMTRNCTSNRFCQDKLLNFQQTMKTTTQLTDSLNVEKPFSSK